MPLPTSVRLPSLLISKPLTAPGTGLRALRNRPSSVTSVSRAAPPGASVFPHGFSRVRLPSLQFLRARLLISYRLCVPPGFFGSAKARGLYWASRFALIVMIPPELTDIVRCHCR